ncbi:sugar porter family MFS transporter [Sporobolomyces koalae]|uniref:sugar porter family MFS transporter n=1 Tax=Sporobolomyces koalae TaxID=500713 RepID=UPI00317E8308
MSGSKPPSKLRHLNSHHHEHSNRSSASLTHVDSSSAESGLEGDRKAKNAKLANPLEGKSEDELMQDVDKFVEHTGLHDIHDLLKKAALVAQDRSNFERLTQLDDEEKRFLREEQTHKWRQTKTLYLQVFMASMAAVVQGMDETVINGANLFYPEQFGIGSDTKHDTLLVGLVNAAPYLCSAVFSCWLTYPLNRYLGRRGAIFVSTFFAGACCIWSAVTNTWWHLFIARFFLGVGIGPKSATVPILTSEVSPTAIRGALVMQWQVWTAFGIMFGTVSSLIFQKVPDKPGITGLNWRLMLGSACLPAILVCAQVYFTPESPRWLLSRGEHRKAYESLLRLRRSPIQAAIDLYSIAKSLEVQKEIQEEAPRGMVAQLFREPRNRRAMLASTILMFGQQFCGVNAIAYYSSTIFRNTGASITKSLLGSFGYGLLNWVFALPAFLTIDSFGRRSLLLFTFPFLSFFLFIAGSGFYIKSPHGELGMVTTGVYLFTCFYSSGMGPIPFAYSAEAYPLAVREAGMSLATATTWTFNFVLALVFPLMLVALTPSGAFYFFAGWNMILFFLVLLFVPETKQRSLEELDEVFSMSSARLARYGLQTPGHHFKRIVLRKDVKRSPLHNFNPSEEKDTPQVEHREKA